LRNNRTLWIIVGVILACCCIVGVGVFVLGQPISNYLRSVESGLQLNPISTTSPATSAPSTSVPNGSSSTSAPAGGPAEGGLGDSLLKSDVWNAIVHFESGQNCMDVTSTTIDVVNGPDSKGAWTENWTVNACGQTIVYKVKFATDPKGGTNYTISH
jgi:hypothetical protein